jgi:hypothetical protein
MFVFYATIQDDLFFKLSFSHDIFFTFGKKKRLRHASHSKDLSLKIHDKIMLDFL